MTDLARRVSPPDKQAMTQGSSGGAAAVLMILGVGAAYGMYQFMGFAWAAGAFAAVTFGGAIVVGLMNGPEDDARFKSASRRWSRSYLCLRCGEAVLAGEQGELQVRDRNQTYPEVDLLLRQGQRMQALRAMVDATGLGLAEAGKRLDARARELNV